MWAAGRRTDAICRVSISHLNAAMHISRCQYAGIWQELVQAFFFFFSGRPPGPVEAQNVAVATQDTLSWMIANPERSITLITLC